MSKVSIINPHDLQKTELIMANTKFSKLFGLASIGAFASVVNLGVSAAGFYLMNKKLNQLQLSLNHLGNKVNIGFDNIDASLQSIEYQLIELKAIGFENRKQLQYILQGMYDLQKTIYNKEVATVLVALQGLERLQNSENSAERQRYIDDLSRVRLTFQNELDGISLKVTDHSNRIFQGMMSYRLWAIAGTSEIYGNRRQNHLEKPIEISTELAQKSRLWSHKWGNELISPNEFEGVGRFGYSKLQDKIADDQRLRLARLFNDNEDDDHNFMARMENRGAVKVAKSYPDLGEKWIEQQVGIANTLDMLEETTERLESMVEINKYCHKNRFRYNEWEVALID